MNYNYVVANQTSEDGTITEGERYRIKGIINDFYIVEDNNKTNTIHHSSIFNGIEWGGKELMLRYGRKITINDDLMEAIVMYMDDETREKVHSELASCANEEFLNRYIELNPDFEELLYKEFGIEKEVS